MWPIKVGKIVAAAPALAGNISFLQLSRNFFAWSGFQMLPVSAPEFALAGKYNFLSR